MISVASECAHRACILDPREGARRTVADAARKISATGALPLAITDCLNFGNPEVPEVMWEFVEAIEGLKEGCLALNTPVVSGNVSFYNETRGQSIPPSPTIGMVGWMDQSINPIPGFVDEEGLDLWLLKGAEPSLDGSLWQQHFCGSVGGELTKIDFDTESRVQSLTRGLVKRNLLKAAHNLGSGGLAVSLAKMLFNGETTLGLQCESFLEGDGLGRYFGEAPSFMILACSPQNSSEIVSLSQENGIEILALGQTGGQEFNLGDIHLDINRLYGAWKMALNPLMGISSDS
jgi:phosphoribosylformylglycinamidine synthase